MFLKAEQRHHGILNLQHLLKEWPLLACCHAARNPEASAQSRWQNHAHAAAVTPNTVSHDSRSPIANFSLEQAPRILSLLTAPPKSLCSALYIQNRPSRKVLPGNTQLREKNESRWQHAVTSILAPHMFVEKSHNILISGILRHLVFLLKRKINRSVYFLHSSCLNRLFFF